MNPDTQKNPDEIGALWSRSGTKGMYMTGNVQINGVVHEIVCFTNDRKKNEKQPDWRILKSRPKGEKSQSADDQDF